MITVHHFDPWATGIAPRAVDMVFDAGVNDWRTMDDLSMSRRCEILRLSKDGLTDVLGRCATSIGTDGADTMSVLRITPRGDFLSIGVDQFDRKAINIPRNLERGNDLRPDETEINIFDVCVPP